jgi:hypothetical protein
MNSAAKAMTWPGLSALDGLAIGGAISPVRRSRGERQGEDGKGDGGLADGRDRHLPAGAHAAERRASVEAGQREERRAEQQQVHDGEQIRHGVEGQRRDEHGDEQRHHDCAAEDHERRQMEDPRRVP